jgi:uncharacterized membrane protein YdjX (TVP38/TMEM64 family)
LVLVLIGALYAAAKGSGLLDTVDAESVRREVAAAGVWSVVVFIVLFAAGGLMHIPGFVFLAAAVLLFELPLAITASVAGGLFSVTVSFVVVRAVGGRPLAAIERPLLKRILAHLDDHPIRTIFVLRLLFWTSAPINYALAMTDVKLRDYIVGSGAGLVPALVAVCVALHYVL